jgi:hypothetical protein
MRGSPSVNKQLVLRLPPASFLRMPRATRSLMSRSAVSGEVFSILAHFDDARRKSTLTPIPSFS